MGEGGRGIDYSCSKMTREEKIYTTELIGSATLQ